MAPRKLSDSDKSELIDLYKQPGQTTTTLAEQFGVSNSTVSRVLKSTIPPEEYRELISQKRMASSDKAAPAAKAKVAKKEPAKKEPAKKEPAKKEPEQKAPEKKAPEKKASDTTKAAKVQPNKKSALKAEPEAGDDTDRLVNPPANEIEEADTAVKPPKLKLASPEPALEAPAAKGTRRRRRSQPKPDDDEQLPLLTDSKEIPEEAPEETTEETSEETPKKVGQDRQTRPAAPKLVSAEVEDEDDEDDDDDDLDGLDETLGDDFGDDDDLEDEDDDEDEGEVDMPKPKLQAQNAMEIMPLGLAVLPKPCYLVVDMRSELITRPLSEFADLGQVPSSEEKSKTLPVFDNHRVARRFSRNKQRVIKVPDGSLITRTSPYLQAKGITRLLVDGQVFALADVE